MEEADCLEDSKPVDLDNFLEQVADNILVEGIAVAGQDIEVDIAEGILVEDKAEDILVEGKADLAVGIVDLAVDIVEAWLDFVADQYRMFVELVVLELQDLGCLIQHPSSFVLPLLEPELVSSSCSICTLMQHQLL